MTGVRPRFRAALVAISLGVLLAAAPAAAQPAYFGGGTSSVESDSARDAELDARAAQIAATLRCPVCRGQSVLESSSQIAREMQALIREKLEAGETPGEIEAFFIASYGDFILLRPRAQGLNILVYVLPGVAFALGLGLIALKLRPGRGGRQAALAGAIPTPEEDKLDPDDRAWLEAAVRGD